jgi:hypothetical protein
MNTLSVLASWGSFISGFGFCMALYYRCGRVGWRQVAYWLGEARAERSTGGVFAYLSTIFGPLLSKLWLFLGLPAVVLDVLLTLSGHGYSTTQWFHDVGLGGTTQGVGVILAACVAAYLLGRMFGSRQRDFNNARLLYDRVVATKGYWFDHRANSSHYAEARVRAALQTSERLYGRILEDLTRGQGPQFMAKQNQMILHYQRALLYCTLGQHTSAKEAINRARQVKRALPPSFQWEPQEEEAFESQILFLEGEIAFVEGRRDHARECFTGSQRIDMSLGDRDGVSKDQDRLDLIG